MSSAASLGMPVLDTMPVFDKPASTTVLSRNSYDMYEGSWLAMRRESRKKVLPNYYPNAYISQQPVFSLPAQIDNFFLEQPEGKVIRLVAQWLLKKEAVSEKSEKELYLRLNKALSGGMCRSGAISYLLHAKEKQEKVKELKNVLSVDVARRVFALFNQLAPHLQQALIPYRNTDQVAKAFDTMLQLTEKLKWVIKKLAIVDTVKEENRASIIEKIKELCNKTNKADLIVRFAYEDTAEGHVIVVRPSQNKLYDENFGELSWGSEEALFSAVAHYINVDKVSRATIEVVR